MYHMGAEIDQEWRWVLEKEINNFFFQNKANKEMDILFGILAHQLWKQQAWGRSSCCPLNDRKEGELEKTPQ